MSADLAAAIKTQVLVNLEALKDAGAIKSILSYDLSVNPLASDAPDGYPLAIVSMPRVTADFEDQATNLRTYRIDILFVMDPQANQADTDVEHVIDQVLNQFDTNFTLSGAAVAAVLPAEIEGGPVSTGDRSMLVFDVILRVRTLYATGT